MTVSCNAHPGTDYRGVPLPDDYVRKLESVKARRPRRVIDELLRVGSVSSERLQEMGYEHAPRAVRDVRELGFALKTFRVNGRSGRKIALYAFDNPDNAVNKLSKALGRTALSDELRNRLISAYGAHCFLTLVEVDPSDLQVDHRVPYEIGGEPDHDDLSQFMLLTGSANRRKSWACEHCSNWKRKDPNYCRSCFYAYPENYTHVADRDERILMIVFSNDDVSAYDRMKAVLGERASDYWKNVIIRQYSR